MCSRAMAGVSEVTWKSISSRIGELREPRGGGGFDTFGRVSEESSVLFVNTTSISLWSNDQFTTMDGLHVEHDTHSPVLGLPQRGLTSPGSR